MKLCKSHSVGLFAWTPLNDNTSKDFQVRFAKKGMKKQDLGGTYPPDVVLNVDVVYWFHHQEKEKTIQKLTNYTSCCFYLSLNFRFFKTVHEKTHFFTCERWNRTLYQLNLTSRTEGGVIWRIHKAAKNTGHPPERGVKTLVFCAECKTTVVEMSLCATRKLYICKHVQ